MLNVLKDWQRKVDRTPIKRTKVEFSTIIIEIEAKVEALGELMKGNTIIALKDIDQINFADTDATEHLTNSWLIFKTFNKQSKEVKSANKNEHANLRSEGEGSGLFGNRQIN